MSHSMLGGNLADMDAMARQFGQRAHQVREIVAALNTEAAKVNVSWTGPGATRFGEAWQNYKAAFERMAVELEEASKVINTYRANIESATR
ncbi:WXG100 family type VII secretion target [Planomonospora corallina]|uniref:ESAT-6-like protein n=1 Tax=Planomonospora corallina TaxID=1806052 RepID=A0ABV8I244_9ACTN